MDGNGKRVKRKDSFGLSVRKGIEMSNKEKNYFASLKWGGVQDLSRSPFCMEKYRDPTDRRQGQGAERGGFEPPLCVRRARRSRALRCLMSVASRMSLSAHSPLGTSLRWMYRQDTSFDSINSVGLELPWICGSFDLLLYSLPPSDTPKTRQC